ncbi:hypothetical protein [Candidatus Laterigemmans baculatus]|uniref:hypothetical protein n=1 Tax=Candidatus Laterigemmans baculatus TaxID=2770505 RepID=UPI0013D97CB9|nr:hypothetical protein [Candidatus Laterigemmans baculatus]
MTRASQSQRDAYNRRAFLQEVGQGMLVAGLGSTLACDLGVSTALAEEGLERLTFGPLEPLVSLLQETPPDRLQPILVSKLSAGEVDLQQLTAAGLLANARTFGGEDYVGFHTFMALPPALQMALELPAAERPLPILKVLYRNSARIQDFGGGEREVLQPISAASSGGNGKELRELVRKLQAEEAERRFAAAVNEGPAEQAYDQLQFTVQDEVDVHRVVLAWRAWEALDLTGQEQAHTLLRQSLRYCLKNEAERRQRGYAEPEIRRVLPRLLDQYQLTSLPAKRRKVDDAWLTSMAETIFASSRSEAADAVAAALADGVDPEAVGQAMSQAANLLVLHDPGQEKASSGRPAGSVHGASTGVHASDAANAWRHIARVSGPRNTIASLIVGAFHTAGQNSRALPGPLPHAEHLDQLAGDSDTGSLLRKTDEAIRENNQQGACAAIQRYGEQGGDPRPVFDLLRRYATSEDGALHAEKYFRTVSEEFATARPAFRWSYLVALGRVTASEFGFPAPGAEQARELLKA